MSTFAAVVLFIGVTAYAVLGGADYGAGFWDLTAGGARRGRDSRHLIDQTLAPVWEANHVWLIFCLVMLWTGFPSAFAAIMTTLYIPLGLAALGIVVCGSGFAFRKVVVKTDQQRATGAAFATSVITPFFLGTVAGGIASGRVPADGHGNPVTSWVNPTSLLGGVLAIGVCAFVGLSAACGLASIALLHRAAPRVLQALAVSAAGTVVAGWGVAQYPYLLGTHLRIDNAAAPDATLASLTLVAAAALLLVVPAMALLFVLHQRGRLDTA